MANRILTTASVFALATAAGMSGAAAQNLDIDLSGAVPVLNAAAKSDSVATASQLNLNTKINAVNTIVLLGTPDDPGSHDVDFGTISDLVIDNSISATAIGNMAVQAVDLFTASGAGTLTAATVGTSQFNSNTGTASIDALVTGAQVRSDFQDLGKGSTVGVITSSLLADTSGNISDASIEGNINPLLKSTQGGASVLSPTGLEASATFLVGTSQINLDIDTPTATVIGSRIGLQATVDNPADSIDGSSLTLDDNLARARIYGNDATNTVFIGNGKATTLEGAAGVSNLQINADLGADPFSALVGDREIDQNPQPVIIEIGDALNGNPIADLDGSSVSFQGNTMLSEAVASTAANALTVDKGINVEGLFTQGSQFNFAINGGGSAVLGDLFIHSAQTTLVGSDAALGFFEGFEPVMAVTTSDVEGSTVTADGNMIAAIAMGNQAGNDLVVTDSATFNGYAAISSAQLDFSKSVATNLAFMGVGVATEGGDGVVDKSAITEDGNTLLTQAFGNYQSSALDITGTDVKGTGRAVPLGVFVDRPSGTDSLSVDFSVLNIQLLDSNDVGGDAGARADAFGLIVAVAADVDGAVDSVFTASTLSVSGNVVTAQAAANVATDPAAKPDAGIDIDATTFTGTVALVNDQTVLNEALITTQLQSSLPGFLIGAFVTPETIATSEIHVDGNKVRAQAWGNLADASVNSIDITGVTVSDGSLGVGSGVGAGRDATSVSTSGATEGFVLINDQSVEDLEGSGVLTSVALGSLAIIDFAGNTADSTVTDTKISANGNTSLSTATANDAASHMAVTATTVNAAVLLGNVQSLADEDDDGASGAIGVQSLGQNIGIEGFNGQDFLRTDLEVVGNSIGMEARVNKAASDISVTATTMVVENVIPAFGSNPSTLDESGTVGKGEVVLVNDQYIDALNILTVATADAGFYVSLFTIDGGYVDGAINVDSNRIRALSQGNDATNTVTLNVGSFDLTGAQGGNPGSAPVAAIVSNQSGGDGVGLITTQVAPFVSAGAVIYVNDSIDFLDEAELSVSGNKIEALAGSNNVVNKLDVSGTTFAVTGGIIGPSGEVIGSTVDVSATSIFVVASRQVNDYDVTALTFGETFAINAFGLDSITGSDLKVDNNLMTTEARGNDASNTATSNFTANGTELTTGAQTMVVNYQTSTDSAPQIVVATSSPLINASATGDGNVFTDSALSASGNTIQGLASAHRAWNTLAATGGASLTNIGGGALAAMETGGVPASVYATGGFGIVNVQGADTVDAAESSSVAVSVEAARIESDIDDFVSGSLKVENNTILGSGIDASAVNTLTLKAGAAAGGVNGLSAAIASQQILSADDFVDVKVLNPGIGSLQFGITDMSDEESAAVSIAGNKIQAEAIGGAAFNTLAVSAGATVNGTSGPQSIAMGDVFNDPLVVSADVLILNAQFTGGSGGIAAKVDGLDFSNPYDTVGVTILNDVVNDTVSVDKNRVTSTANGFIAENGLSIKAGTSSVAAAVVANLQGNGFDGTMTPIRAETEDVTIRMMIADSGVENSGLSVSNNLVGAGATGNSAVNYLLTKAGASLQAGSGAGASIDPTATTPINVTAADYSVLNNQYVEGDDGLIEGSVSNVVITIDGLSGATGVNGSALNVSGNQVRAAATGNTATNVLVLNTGTFEHPAAVIANSQRLGGVTVNATISGVTIGIGDEDTINAASDGSSFKVTGNKVSATSIGNYSANVISSGE